jgi:hypothetical protein
MLKKEKLRVEDLEVLIKNTSQKMGINQGIVEKDYWVCFILDYLFNYSEWKNNFVFKGGTSLSKCFNVIKRFSEDIDLILDWRQLGYNEKEPWEKRSNNKQDKFNKESSVKVGEFIEKELIPKMKKDLKKIIGESFNLIVDEKDKQTVLFEYPKIFQYYYVNPVVRLEIGALAEWTPSEISKINSYIAENYPKIFQDSFVGIKTVSPERTFWEKVTILHHEANRPKNLLIPDRYARHYYDLYCFAKSKYKKTALEQVFLLEKVAKFKTKFYPRKWAKYEEATSDKIKLLPEEYRYDEIKKDYIQMKEMIFGKSPEFEEIIDALKILEIEIHETK